MIVPAAARRFAAVVLAASVLVLSSCAAKAGSGSPTQPSEPTPSVSATPAEAVVPFDGDCSAMLTVADATELLGASATLSKATLTSSTPDLNASLQLIGAMSCLWTTNEGAYLQVAVFPTSETSPVVVAKTAGSGCESGYPNCWASRTVKSAWIYAESSVAETANGSLALVADRVAAQPDPTPGATDPAWWTLPACDEVAGAVSAAAWVDGLEPGFPGDSVPSGPVWDTADAAGVVRWCSWYSQSDANAAVVQLNLQPGAGRPAPALLDAAGATAQTVPGSDAGWNLGNDSGTTRLLTMSGANRLTVAVLGLPVQRSTAVASAVIGQLNGTR